MSEHTPEVNGVWRREVMALLGFLRAQGYALPIVVTGNKLYIIGTSVMPLIAHNDNGVGK